MRILIAILIFSLIVLIHEFGHFILAKKNGIVVNEFCLGLGPTLFGIQKGETKYSIKLLPFGGACIMLGEDEESASEGAFNQKSVWARISVVLAGPVFNFLLAFILAIIIIGNIGYDAPIIVQVMDGYPAQEAGLEEGDRIVKINNQDIHVYREVMLYSQFLSTEQETTIAYERDGKIFETTLTPKLDKESGRYLIGYYGSGVRTKGNALTTLKYSAYEVKYWISYTVQSLKLIFKGQVQMNDISGPVGLVDLIGDSYESSKSEGAFIVWLNMLNISIFLSANLGVMNLLPIPALDGGRLVFLFLEAIRGKKVSPSKEGMVHLVGLVLLMGLMILVLFNDIRKLF